MGLLFAFIIVFFIAAIIGAEHLSVRDVFGPYLRKTSNQAYEEEVRSMLIRDTFHLSRDEWKNGMLHTDLHYDGPVEYLAFHSGGFTVPDYYVLKVLERGERKSFRIKKGTDLFNKIRDHHENLKKKRKQEVV